MGDIPTWNRERVNLRSLRLCERCAALGAEVHHRRRGHPRNHAVSNLARMCRPCHQQCTTWMKPDGWPVRCGYVLLAGSAPLETPILLGATWWAFLTDSGKYLIGSSTFDDIGEIWEAARVKRDLASLDPFVVLSSSDRPPVPARQLDEPPAGDSEVDGLVHPVVEVDLPSVFRYQLGESFTEFLLRLKGKL